MLLSLCNALLFGLPLGCLLLIRVGIPKSVEVQRVWEVYDDRLQFVSRQDALQLDESLDAGDVSRAWLVWSGDAEAAVVDAYQLSGGPLPCRGLVLGRRSDLFRVVRLGDHQVRKLRGNAADAHDAADVFLCRDSSVALLLDMRRRFKAAMNVLDAMIRYGVSLSRSVELTAQWDRILALGPLYPVALDDLTAAWRSVIFMMLFLIFIIVSVTSLMRLLFIGGMRLLGDGGIGFGRIPYCTPTGGFVQIWFTQLLFSRVSPILHLVVLECFLILLGLMRNSEKFGFPTVVALGKERPALRNSLMRLRGGYHFYLRFICLV